MAGIPKAFWRTHELGTGLISIIPRVQRPFSAHPGLNRVTITPGSKHPNWNWNLTALIPFTNMSWSREDFHANLTDLLIAVLAETVDKPTGPLCWIEDSAHTTTTTANELEGDNVVVDLTSLATLDVSTNDYVLILDAVEQVAILVKVEGVGADTITVDLSEDVDSGATVYKVFIGYAGSIIHAIDPGDPVEQARDRYRFQTRWKFTAGAPPVRSPSGA